MAQRRRPDADLHPTRFNVSVAEDIDDGRVVGWGGVVNTGSHAYVWSGSVSSIVDLHPAGAEFSEARGIRGNQIVGRGGRFDGSHALMWPDGTPGNVVDLHPRGYFRSAASATDGHRQGGSGTLTPSAMPRPIIWSGTAESAVDLLPPGALGGGVSGVSGEQQVGSIWFRQGVITHAMLWTGTAESALDLHPLTGFDRTVADDTNGLQQVGYGLGLATRGANHALLWNGTDVPLDLHAFLPAGATESFARGIDEHGNVVGHATFGQSTRAVMWVYVPEPATAAALLLLPTLLLSRRARTTRRTGACPPF